MSMTTIRNEPEGLASRRIRILHVEDDDFTSTCVARLLTHNGFLVQSAANGSEALDVIRSQPGEFDLLITDQSMPGLSSLELVESLRHMDFQGRTIVFASGVTGDLRGRFFRFGADRIVQKASGIKALLEAAVQILKKHRALPGGLTQLQNLGLDTHGVQQT